MADVVLPQSEKPILPPARGLPLPALALWAAPLPAGHPSHSPSPGPPREGTQAGPRSQGLSAAAKYGPTPLWLPRWKCHSGPTEAPSDPDSFCLPPSVSWFPSKNAWCQESPTCGPPGVSPPLPAGPSKMQPSVWGASGWPGGGLVPAPHCPGQLDALPWSCVGGACRWGQSPSCLASWVLIENGTS